MQGTAQSRAEGCGLRCLGREGDGGGEGTTLRRAQAQTPSRLEQSTGRSTALPPAMRKGKERRRR